MKSHFRLTCLGLVLAGLSFVSASSTAWAQGGGIALYEVGIPDQGASAAGAGARAQDASTAYTNPAGMGWIEYGEVLMGTQMGFIASSLKLSSTTTPPPPGTNFSGGGWNGGWVPGGGMYAVIPISEQVRLGMAINGVWGGSAKYDTGWAGRAFVTEATMIGMNIEPSISWRPVEWFGIGVGLNIVYANLNVKFRPGPVAANNRYELHNADDWGFGGTLGLMFEPVKGTRIGIKYNSHVKLDLEGRAKLGAMGKKPLELAMELPQGVNVSLYHEVNEQLAILADVGWYDWSAFGTMPSTVGVVPLPIDRKWRDTWRVGLGAQYQIDDNWLVRGGWSYDSSPVKDHYRYPDLPVADVNRISFGAEYKIDETFTVGANYTLGIMGNTNVDDVALPPTGTTVLKGRYRPAMMHFFAITMKIRF